MVFENVQDPEEIIVTETSAYLYLPNEERISAYTDHSMIAKLGDGLDSLYRIIRDLINSSASVAPSIIRLRLLRVEGVATLSAIVAAYSYTSLMFDQEPANISRRGSFR